MITKVSKSMNGCRCSLIVLFISLMLFTACGNKDAITIEGTLQNGAGKTIYIEEMSPESRIFLDSITLDKKGHFKFKYDMPYRTFYNVHVSEADYIVLLPDFGEVITIDGSYDSLSNTYHLQAGRESQLLWQLQDYANQGSYVLQDLVKTDQQNRQLLEDGKISQSEFDAAHAVTDSIYLDVFVQQQQYVVHFIEDNLGSLATLIALYKPFNSHPLINPEDSFEFYEGVLQGLQETLPDNPHTLSFKNQVERTRYQYAK